MQNKKSFAKKIRDKGYYIVLLLCVAAVGVSGYLFCKSLASKGETELLQPELAVQNSVEATSPTEKANAPADVGKAAQAVIGSAGYEDPETAALQTVRPVDGEILQAYSVEQLAYNVTMRDWRTHDGVDFAAEEGAQVLAAADGEVSQVVNDDALGQSVTITHADGYVTHYANLSEQVSVAVGDTVSAGDAIGTVGDTALSETAQASHLHFSVSRNNVSVDPTAFLP